MFPGRIIYSPPYSMFCLDHLFQTLISDHQWSCPMISFPISNYLAANSPAPASLALWNAQPLSAPRLPKRNLLRPLLPMLPITSRSAPDSAEYLSNSSLGCPLSMTLLQGTRHPQQYAQPHQSPPGLDGSSTPAAVLCAGDPGISRQLS